MISRPTAFQHIFIAIYLLDMVFSCITIVTNCSINPKIEKKTENKYIVKKTFELYRSNINEGDG